MNQRPLTPETKHSCNPVSELPQGFTPNAQFRIGYSGNEDKSGTFHSIVEHVTTFVFPLLCAANVYLVLRELNWLILIFALAVGAPIAWVLADFVSGLIHWFADTYGAEDTPLFGPWLIKPFRQHHVYPKDICTHNLVLTIGNSCTIAVPFQTGLLYLILTDEEISTTEAILAFIFNLFAMAIVATNLFHKWAHAERRNQFVARLQSLRLLLAPSHHALHHTEPFDSNYCITNGWLNPILEKARFFRRLESVIGAVGIKAHHADYRIVAPARTLAAAEIDLGEG